MIRATGGFAFGEIKSKSNPASLALFKASFLDTTPTCSPSSSIKRTSRARILSFKIKLLGIIVHLRVNLRTRKRRVIRIIPAFNQQKLSISLEVNLT